MIWSDQKRTRSWELVPRSSGAVHGTLAVGVEGREVPGQSSLLRENVIDYDVMELPFTNFLLRESAITL